MNPFHRVDENTPLVLSPGGNCNLNVHVDIQELGIRVRFIVIHNMICQSNPGCQP